MLKLFLQFRGAIAAMCMIALCGCLGGTIAQQVARSVFTKAADKVVANAMDVDEDAPSSTSKKTATPHVSLLQNSGHNEDWWLMMSGGFKPLNPTETAALQAAPITSAASEPAPNITPETSALVRVEVLNLLVGAEKEAVYEKARLIGALNLPQAREWKMWHVATGRIDDNNKMITFLIPPALGKLPSGSKTVVEIASAGDLNVARYTSH